MADDVVVMCGGQVVESASADEIFDRPTQPYTQSLMASILLIEEEHERLLAIPDVLSTRVFGWITAADCDRTSTCFAA